MVHENADRVRLPVQQGRPVPERDIEPLWPPDTVRPDADPVAGTPDRHWAPPEVPATEVPVSGGPVPRPESRPTNGDAAVVDDLTIWAPDGHPGRPPAQASTATPLGTAPPDGAPVDAAPPDAAPVDAAPVDAAPGAATDDNHVDTPRPTGGSRPHADSPWAHPPQRTHGTPVESVPPPVPRQQPAGSDGVPGWYPLPAPPTSGDPAVDAPAEPDDAPSTAGEGPAAGSAPPPVDHLRGLQTSPRGEGPAADDAPPPAHPPTAEAVGPVDTGPPAGGVGPATATTWATMQASPPGGAYPGHGGSTSTPPGGASPAGGTPPAGWAPLPAAPVPGWPTSGGWATASSPEPTAPGTPDPQWDAGQPRTGLPYPATDQPGATAQYPAPGQSGQYPTPGGTGAEAAPPRVPTAPASYSEPLWSDGATPTAEDFARRRQARPADPVATMGVRAVLNRTTLGLVKLPPGRHEQEVKHDIEMVRRNFGGLRQVTVVNPKGGAGKTVAILLLAMTFGQKRGGYVLAWDNNETQGTLGMRAQQDFHARTVRDMLRDLGQFQGAHGRVGDLSQYVRSQGEGMFDVLASDESATGGEMLTASAFAEIRDVVSRFYKLIFVDTGNNVRAQNWQAAMDATDQLVVTMSARNDSAETAARMLDHLEQSGRQRLVRQAVTVVSMPPSRKEIDLPAIQEHFAARTRAVLLAPYERLIDTGEPIRYGQLSSATRDAWLKIAAAVAEGL
ncbi:MinD-like ATPase involved in chromosome partitioning or flagellar assembly [Micromonospora inyonensis]|uniref:MinD-like ATPase involved in chromosome partitioning or flagellar assembly n=1 Tax=Micromonospora inyonensis TaxID=47866 RepID=A0A1C6RG99_9ACTN|nr:MinD-like ATPase involved in chromosome partitioning or flagellar assembly [Micromonospora inyonensis]